MKGRAIIAAIALAQGACGEPVVDIGRSRSDAGVARVRDAGSVASDAGVAPRDAGPADAPRPDLAIAALSAPPATHVPGEALSVTVDVENRGLRSARETVVEVRLERVDGPSRGPHVYQIGLVSLPALAAGDRVSRARILPAPDSLVTARYRVVVEVDPDDIVDESDEENNLLDGPFFSVSHLVVVPTEIDFGTVGVGCAIEVTARVENRGATRAIVAPFALDPTTSPAITLDAPTSPRSLAAGSAFDIRLGFAPGEVGFHEGRLLLRHSQLAGDTPLEILGRGDVEPLREEVLEQRAAPQVDLMFVVDDAVSMADERDALAASASALFAHLEAEGIDYRIAVTTADTSAAGARGAFVGDPKVITPSTVDGARVFEASVSEASSKATIARGLEASREALSPANLDTVNAGFLRASASLAVIYVSDRDDASSGDTASYVDFFRTLKAPDGEVRFVAHALVGPAAGCATATYGARFADVARATGGRVDSICAGDFAPVVAQYPGAGFGFEVRFGLEREPLAGSIEVEIDGAVLPESAWRFEPSPPAVVFDQSAVPEPGARITIRYRTSC